MGRRGHLKSRQSSGIWQFHWFWTVLGAVHPIKPDTLSKRLPLWSQCSNTFHLTQGSLRWNDFKIFGSGSPKYLNHITLVLIGIETSFDRQIKGFKEGSKPIWKYHFSFKKIPGVFSHFFNSFSSKDTEFGLISIHCKEWFFQCICMWVTSYISFIFRKVLRHSGEHDVYLLQCSYN